MSGRALLAGPLLVAAVFLGLGDIRVFSDFRGGDAAAVHTPAFNARAVVANVAANTQEGVDAPAASVEVEDGRTQAVRVLLAGTPLEAHAALLVGLADHYGIDWRLMPVIAILESGGGAEACGGNAWGFASCEVRFASFEEGAAVVAASLAEYGDSSPAHILCVWVSGGGCKTQHAVAYVYNAAPLWAALEGAIPLPAMPASPAPLPASGAEAEAASVGEAAAPAATGSEVPEPAGTEMVEAVAEQDIEPPAAPSDELERLLDERRRLVEESLGEGGLSSDAE